MMIKSSSMSALSSISSSPIIDLREWRSIDPFDGRSSRVASCNGIAHVPISPRSKSTAVETSPSQKKFPPFVKYKDLGYGSDLPPLKTPPGSKAKSNGREAWDFDNESVPWPLIKRAQSETDLQSLVRRGHQVGVNGHRGDSFGRIGCSAQDDAGSLSICLQGWGLPSPILRDNDTMAASRRRWQRRRSLPRPREETRIEEEMASADQGRTYGADSLTAISLVSAGEDQRDFSQGGFAQTGIAEAGPRGVLSSSGNEGGKLEAGSNCESRSIFSKELPPGLSQLLAAQPRPHPEAPIGRVHHPEVCLGDAHPCSYGAGEEASTSGRFVSQGHRDDFRSAESKAVATLVVDADERPALRSSRDCKPVGYDDEPPVRVSGGQVAEVGVTGGPGPGGGIRRRGRGGGGGGEHDWGGNGRGNKDEDSTDLFYQQALLKEPGHPLLLRNYARFLCEVQHNLQKAEEYYERAILANPGDGEVLAQYAKLIWEAHRDQERAASYFDQAIQAAPGDCFVLAAYASFLWSTDSGAEEPPTPAPLTEQHADRPEPILPPSSVVRPTQC